MAFRAGFDTLDVWNLQELMAAATAISLISRHTPAFFLSTVLTVANSVQSLRKDSSISKSMP